MIKFGHITARNDKKGQVTVRFERPEACGNCRACGYGSRDSEVTLTSDSQVGEWVRIELPENRFLRATMLVYIFPLLGLLAGMFLGYLLGSGSDLFTVLGAAVGLGLSFGGLFLIDRRVSRKPEWSPKITAVYPEKPDSEELACDRS